jgi:hypothetical protein
VKKHKERRLRTLPDVRRLLSYCINQNLQGMMPDGQLKSISYAAQTIQKTMELIDLEVRLDRLEQQVSNGKSL